MTRGGLAKSLMIGGKEQKVSGRRRSHGLNGRTRIRDALRQPFVIFPIGASVVSVRRVNLTRK